MDKKLPTHRPKTLNALKAVLPIMAMAAPLANASIRPASISRNGLNTRAAISQYEKTDAEQKSQAFGAFGNSHYVKPVSRQVDSEALAFLSENNFLAGGENVVGDTSGDISGLTGRKSFLSCVTASGAPAYYRTGDPIISDSICTILGYTWTDGDNLPPVFPKDNPGVFLTDISLAVGGNITLDFEIEDPPITGANYLDVINVTVSSDNQSAIRNADISVTRDPGTSPGNLFYLTIANVVGQGGANITVTATDDRNNSATDTFFVDTGAVPAMANPAVSITVLEDSGSNAVSTSNFATSDSDSSQTLTWSASGGTKGTPQASGTASTPTTNSTPSSVTYTPTANATGSDSFSVVVSDGINTDSRTVNVTITPVNDEPTISILANQTFNGVGGSAQTVAGFASMSSTGGGADENTQTVLGYVVSETNDPSGVVSSVSIASNGTLTYTPAANVEGVATIQAQVRDSGGTANGGKDLSPPKTFIITVDTLAPSLAEVTAVTSPTNDSTPDVTINISQAGTLALGGSCGSASEGAVAAGNLTFSLTQADNSTPLVDGTYSDCTVTVTDANGNASDTLILSAFQIQLDVIPPTVTQVTAPADDTYMTGETLSFTLTADEVLTVDTAGGRPALDLTIGSSNVSAAYVSGTGSDTLTFSYAVLNNDEDTDGISIDSLSLNGGSITDAAGNVIVTTLNGVANTTGVLVDGVRPTVAITGASGNINAPFTASITFSEDVTGFDVSDIAVSNATLSGFAGTGSTYTVFVTPTADGAVTLDVASATAVDLAGNSNSAATQLSANFDGTVPTVAISGASGFINSAFTATITFSEDVTGFDVSDIAATNATLSAFAGSGSTYTVLVSPNADGSVTLDVAANVAVDVASNSNTAATQLTATYDATVPTVAITGASGNINDAFTATITFSEDVTGFDVSDISASNATLSAFTGSGSTYTVLVTPMADGAVALDVASAVAIDIASNGNTAATQLTVNFDGSLPSVAITGASGFINTPFTATITFSEDVTGFDVSDIAATNAALSAFAGSGSIYTVLVTPTADGEVTLDVASDVALDIADNGNTAATQLTATYDVTVPTAIVTGASGYINAPFTATITFSEDVTGFDVTDITKSNATLSGFAGTGSSYTVLVTPTTDGAVTLNVAANVAVDVASNGNTAATPLVATYDGTVPTVTISGASGYINAPFTATIAFSEDVTGFDVSDIAVSNATLSGFAGTGSTYTVLVTPTADGAVTLDVASATAVDLAGNSNSAATQLSANFDGTVPTVTIVGASGLINAPFTATITFSETVTGFDVSDIVATNATLSAFAGSGSTYTVTVTPTADGEVALNVAANVAVDVASNGNTAATPLTASYDGTTPTVTIAGASGNINSAFTATITFSETVTGFDVSDIVATNATLSAFAGSGSTYTVTVTPTTDGAVALNVAANVAVDVASNGNTAATPLTASYDGTAPTVNIVGASGDINAAFTATLIFSEAVTGFDVSDIVATNASLSDFAGSGSTYTVTVTPTADGEVALNVAANVAVDVASNGNTAATPLAATYDGTAPVLVSFTRLTPSTEATAEDSVSWQVTFSEEVSGVTPASFTLTGTTAMTAMTPLTAATIYQVTASGGDLPSLDGEVGLNLSASAVIADVAGNALVIAEPVTDETFTLDNTRPTVEIAAPVNSPNAFSITVTFSEDVSDFEEADIVVTNATITDFSGSGTTYTATVTPTVAGTDVTLQVNADVSADVVNNPNEASDLTTVTTNTHGVVSINGFAIEGQTLTAIVVDPDNITNTITYQWTSTGAIATVVGSDETYVIQTSDIGNTITVEASYTDDAGFAETPVSSPTATVVSIEQNAWSNIGATVGTTAAAPTFNDYRNVGMNSLTDDQLTRMLSIINRAVAHQPTVGDIDELSELEALIAVILEGQDDDKDGLPNILEDDGLADTDRDGIDDRDDVDADNDGIRDNLEYAALRDMQDDDGDGIVNLFDFDADGDGHGDNPEYTDDNLNGVIDQFETLAGFISHFGVLVDADGDGLINSLDIDADGDGVPDVIEAGLPDVDENALVDEGAAIITDYADLPDADGDGVADFLVVKSNGTDTDLSVFLTMKSNSTEVHLNVADVLAELDANLDGMIDDVTDIDQDGLSDAVDNAIGVFGSAKFIEETDTTAPVDLAPGATLDDLDGDGVLDTVDPSVNTGIDVKVASKGSMSLGILMLLGAVLVLMRRRTRLLVAMPLAIVAGHSQAADTAVDTDDVQDSNFSFVTAVGLSKFDTDIADSLELTDENGAGFMVGMGYNFSDELAAQVTYSLLGKAGVGTGWVDYSSLATYLQYRPEVVSYGKLRGQLKLGINRVFYEGAAGLNLDKDSADVFTFALGADYAVNQSDAVEFMFTSYAEDVHFYSVGYRHSF